MPDVWPAIGTELPEENTVTPDGFTFVSVAVPPIAAAAVALNDETSALAAEATERLSDFDAGVDASAIAFGGTLLRVESAASSTLDGMSRSARAIAEAELDDFDGSGAPVARNSKMIEAALATTELMSDAVVLNLQSLLFGGGNSAAASGYRTEQVWIVGGEPAGQPEEVYIPPPFEQVPAAMRDLAAFAARTDIAPLVHAALTHAQFETIHPLIGGNGRIGRALVQQMLRRSGLTPSIVVPLSAGLLAQKDRYFSALTAYRAGEINEIVAVFASAVQLSIANAEAMFRTINEVRGEWMLKLATTRGGATAHVLADVALQHPVLNSKFVETTFDVPPKTALGALARLEELRILNLATSPQRARLWIAPEVTAALTAFAARSQPPI